MSPIRVYYNCGAPKEAGLIATYQNAVIIHNPSARGLFGRRAARFERAVEILRKAGHGVSAVATGGPGTAGAVARDWIEKGADLILAAGGDGTINEVANGMVGSPVPMGILPGGTANVLGIELGVGARPEMAAQRLGECVPRRIATGVLRASGESEPRHFLLMAGVGFDAAIVNKVDPELKRRSGKLAFWIAGFREVFSLQPMFEVFDGSRTLRCSFALASRVRNYGGTVELAGHASLASEDFAAVLIQGRRPVAYLRLLPAAFLGHLEKQRGVTALRARKLEFRAATDAPVYVQVDGEAAGRLPASVEILPDALTLLVPPEFRG